MLRQILLGDRHPPTLYRIPDFDAFGETFPSPALPYPFPAFFLIMYGSITALMRIIKLAAGLSSNILPDVAWITEPPNRQRAELQNIFWPSHTPFPRYDVPYQKTLSLWVISGVSHQPGSLVWPRQHSHCVITHDDIPHWFPSFVLNGSEKPVEAAQWAMA